MKGLLIWGAGSQARLLLEYVDQLNDVFLTMFDPFGNEPEFDFTGTFASSRADLDDAIKVTSHYIVAIGGSAGLARTQIHEYLNSSGLAAVEIIHPTSYIAPTVSLGMHCQILMGAKVHHFSTIGDCCILNCGSLVDHECIIGKGVHIMGGANLAGRVTVGDYASIGTNATILPDIKVGAGAFVGAGAVVTKDVPEMTVVAGNPARFLRRNQPVSEPLIEELQRSAT